MITLDDEDLRSLVVARLLLTTTLTEAQAHERALNLLPMFRELFPHAGEVRMTYVGNTPSYELPALSDAREPSVFPDLQINDNIDEPYDLPQYPNQRLYLLRNGLGVFYRRPFIFRHPFATQRPSADVLSDFIEEVGATLPLRIVTRKILADGQLAWPERKQFGNIFRAAMLACGVDKAACKAYTSFDLYDYHRTGRIWISVERSARKNSGVLSTEIEKMLQLEYLKHPARGYYPLKGELFLSSRTLAPHETSVTYVRRNEPSTREILAARGIVAKHGITLP